MVAKKMTLNNLQSQSNREYKSRKLLIDGYEVVIEPKFKPSKIQQLIQELIEKSEYAEQNGFIINVVDYMFILLLKHFTDIKFSDKYEKQIQMMQVLVDLNYFERIISEFDQSEIDKLTQIFQNNVDNISKLLDKNQGVEENA